MKPTLRATLLALALAFPALAAYSAEPITVYKDAS